MADKTVLITGTSSGIGAACATRQARAGWRVYAGVRRAEDGERLVSSIGNHEGAVVPVTLDVTNREHIDKVLAQIETEAGSLDGLVNNAGIGLGGPVELVSDEDWRRQFDVNFFSLVTLTREAMPLVDRAGGRFVHIGSIGGRVTAPGLGPYSASKHAIEALNWALRAELGRNTGMTSSVIEPGEVKTLIWDKAEGEAELIERRIREAGREDRYRFIIDANVGFIEEGRSRGVDPDKVAAAVEHALTARRPKARYLVGPDAKAVGLFSRLPDRVREGLLGMNVRRFERAGRKRVRGR